MTAAIQAVDVTRYYGRILAVDHLSLEVEEGEFFGLLGPNGAGKTTLIRILTGLVAPTSGKALVSGYDVLREPVKAKKQFGLVPEVSNLYFDMTAWENLIFMAKLYAIPEGERVKRAMDLLEFFGLKERLRSPVKEFSKGMKRRLTIAAALIHRPRILFLDEPTSGLDVQSSRLIREKLRQLNEEEGVTVFLTTHHIEEADELCGRLAILNHGRVVALDSAGNLKGSMQVKDTLEVSFDAPTQIDGALERQCNKVVKLGEGRFQLYARNSSSILPLVAEFAQAKGLNILSIKTLMPTLEDVFIKYTGVDALTAERLEQLGPRRGER